MVAVVLALTLAIWEVVGVTSVLGTGTVPPLHEVIRQLWTDRSLYPGNLATTGREALLGFLIGNAVAIALAYLFVLWRGFERALSGLLVALFSLPPIAAAPVLAVAFDGTTAKVALSALMVFFPTLVSTLLGLRSVDRATLDMISAFGGNDLTALRRAQARASLPGLLMGLRIAAPAALLGAILGEFLGGTSGLGVFMLNSLAQFDAARTWGAGLVATALASIAFFAFMVLGRRVAAGAAAPTVGVGMELVAGGATRSGRLAGSVAQGLLGLAAIIAGWYAFVVGLGLNPLFAKTPLDVAKLVFGSSQSGRVWDALGQTVPYAMTGLAGGLAAALGGAIVFVLVPTLERATLPLALVLQSVPLVAMAPVLITIFGRGATVTIVIATMVTFFPSLVTVTEGLRSAPGAALDVVSVYGGSPVTAMWRVRLPHALPYLLAAAKLVAPLALLGVMIAQWLATGTGLGGDLQNARFQLDFDVVWAEAAVATGFAVVAYLAIGLLETFAARRFSSGGSR